MTLFERFGGTRPMAAALGKPPSTVNSWKEVGRIPASEQPEVLRRGREMGLDVSAEDVMFPLRAAGTGHDGSVGADADHAPANSAVGAAVSPGIGGALTGEMGA